MLSRSLLIKVNFSLDSELFIRNLLQDCEKGQEKKKKNVSRNFNLPFCKEKIEELEEDF